MTWENLGSLTALDSWQKFPVSANNCSLLKVAFLTTGNFQKIYSYCWLRRAWAGTSPKQVEQEFRVYPRPEHTLIEVPIPKSLAVVGQTMAEFEIKLGYKRRWSYAEPAWSVNLEGWVGE